MVLGVVCVYKYRYCKKRRNLVRPRKTSQPCLHWKPKSELKVGAGREKGWRGSRGSRNEDARGNVIRDMVLARQTRLDGDDHLKEKGVLRAARHVDDFRKKGKKMQTQSSTIFSSACQGNGKHHASLVWRITRLNTFTPANSSLGQSIPARGNGRFSSQYSILLTVP